MSPPTPAPAAWHARDAAATLAALQASPHGLGAAEAAQRLQRHGPNRLAEAPAESPLIRLARQFHNLLLYVLMALRSSPARWTTGWTLRSSPRSSC